MINSLRMVLIYAVEFLDIIPDSAKADPDIAAIAQLIAAYDALAPDWSQAPDGAKWCVIDPTDDCYWHEVEPTPDSLSWESGTADFAGFVFAIPLGVDWRLLKWQRPEVTP